VPHINADTLLVHPTFAILRIVGEIEGIFLSWIRWLVNSLVRPKLISATIVEAFAPLVLDR